VMERGREGETERQRDREMEGRGDGETERRREREGGIERMSERENSCGFLIWSVIDNCYLNY